MCVDAADAATEPYPDPEERCYSLFARLAGVRNGRGFAGIETGEAVQPLFADRGLPDDEGGRRYDPSLITDDMSETDYEALYLGDHSHTWASFEELLASADPDAPSERALDVEVRLTGVVELDAYKRWLATGELPRDYCGDVSGAGIKVYDHDRYAAERTRWISRETVRQEAMLVPGLAEHEAARPRVDEPPTALEAALSEVIAGVDSGNRYAPGPVTKPYFRIRWRGRPLASCGFLRWLRSDRVAEMVARRGGPQNVRLLVGFNS